VPIRVEPNEENLRYLQTKRDRLGHLLDDDLHEPYSDLGIASEEL
jgi:hypothetical protein